METTSVNAGLPLQSTAKTGTISSDFETFLRMLTTQIQNQDPLSPMEADQFASQLAAFSMVEQQTLTNQKLEAMVQAVSNGSMAEYSSLVGRVAVHDAAFQFTGNSVDFEIDGVPDNSKLVILDNRNVVIAERAVTLGQTRVLWEGTGTDDRIAPLGNYSAELRRISDDLKLGARVSTAASVEEVHFTSGGVDLLLADGTVISERQVLRIR